MGSKTQPPNNMEQKTLPILVRVRSEQRSYHSTGAESYYGPNTKFKGFSRFFLQKFYNSEVLQTRGQENTVPRHLDSNSLEELTASR